MAKQLFCMPAVTPKAGAKVQQFLCLTKIFVIILLKNALLFIFLTTFVPSMNEQAF
jgi:hypothetical protein